jgi:hypothetical protein
MSKSFPIADYARLLSPAARDNFAAYVMRARDPLQIVADHMRKRRGNA